MKDRRTPGREEENYLGLRSPVNSSRQARLNLVLLVGNLDVKVNNDKQIVRRAL
jgi:hypothetical protein